MDKKCPNCGKEMKVTIAGSAKNYECESCEYAYATTIAEGIEWDAKEYTIVLEKNEDASADQIKVISSLSALNFLKSKEILLEGGAFMKGRATEIKKVIALLQQESIQFRITPEFLYDSTI